MNGYWLQYFKEGHRHAIEIDCDPFLLYALWEYLYDPATVDILASAFLSGPASDDFLIASRLAAISPCIMKSFLEIMSTGAAKIYEAASDMAAGNPYFRLGSKTFGWQVAALSRTAHLIAALDGELRSIALEAVHVTLLDCRNDDRVEADCETIWNRHMRQIASP